MLNQTVCAIQHAIYVSCIIIITIIIIVFLLFSLEIKKWHKIILSERKKNKSNTMKKKNRNKIGVEQTILQCYLKNSPRS